MNNPKKLYCNVGINDATYAVHKVVNNVRIVCPFYSRWCNVLNRCYSDKEHIRNPSYIGCSVVTEWHTFSNFKAWMEKQDWEGKELDKDILVEGNKIYGPDTCAFVNKETNYFLRDIPKRLYSLPVGVFIRNSGRYSARVKNQGKWINLGTFDSPEEAQAAWYNKKRELAIALSLTQTDKRVADALLLRFPLKTQPQNFTASLS